MQEIQNTKVAIMATDGFEEIELSLPQDKLIESGIIVHIVSDKPILKSWDKKQWYKDFKVDHLIGEANAKNYAMLLLPGGVLNADKLRRNSKAVEWIKEFKKQDKFIAAICHGPQLLIEADLVKGKKVTSHYAIKTDMINAGAAYSDKKVIRHDKFITAQGAEDTEEFTKEIISALKS